MECNAALPADFVLYSEWPEYLEEKMHPAWMRPEWIGEHPRGLRLKILHFFIEMYASDQEPSITTKGNPHPRLLIWQPLSRVDIPRGWSKSRFLTVFFDTTRTYKEGYARLGAAGKPWSETQRRMRRRWSREFEGHTYMIEKVSSDVFWEAYASSLTWRNITKIHRRYLRTKIERDLEGERAIDYRIVRANGSGEIVAGLATLDSRICRSSYYFMAFITEPGKEVPAMTGLVDDWFKRSEQKGFSTVQFGRFHSERFPRKNRSWSGFSDFKAGFGTEYIEFPPALFRYVRRNAKGSNTV